MEEGSIVIRRGRLWGFGGLEGFVVWLWFVVWVVVVFLGLDGVLSRRVGL